MASLTDDPSLVASRQTARRDYGLLNRAYRRAKMKGDFAKAFDYAQQGDAMGLPVGRPAHMEEIEGAGEQRYGRNLAISGAAPNPGGLDGYDSRHSSQGGPGVGGYNFNQGGAKVTSYAPVPRTGYLQSPDANGMPTAMTLTKPQQSAPILPSPEGGQTSGGYAATQPQQIPNQQNSGGGYNLGKAGSFTGQVDQRAAFSRAWNNASTQPEKDALVQRASGLGVSMNQDLADEALSRLDTDSPANRPNTSYSTLSPADRLAWDSTAARDKRMALRKAFVGPRLPGAAAEPRKMPLLPTPRL